MKINRAEDGSATVELSPEELVQFKMALERLNATFVRLAPVMKRFMDGIKAIQPELDKAREVCQRLDPAFSGPPEQIPMRRIDPETGRSRLEEESFPFHEVPRG